MVWLVRVTSLGKHEKWMRNGPEKKQNNGGSIRLLINMCLLMTMIRRIIH